MSTRGPNEKTLPPRLQAQHSSAMVDRIRGVTTEDWNAAGIASDKAQLAAYERILKNQRVQTRLLAALVVCAVSLTVAGGANVMLTSRRLDRLEQRIDALEHRSAP